jgi:hypothetical protein
MGFARKIARVIGTCDAVQQNLEAEDSGIAHLVLRFANKVTYFDESEKIKCSLSTKS